MVNATKNIQSKATLTKLVQHAFPKRRLEQLQELTEGYFNIAYEASFYDGTTSILKIAPHPGVAVMTYEQNIMETEVRSMQLVTEQTKVPLPEVEFYDSSCTLCSAPYFFMKKIKGESLAVQKPQLTQQQLSDIYTTAGSLNKEINQVTNEYFGYMGQPAFQGKSWHDIFAKMLSAVMGDAEKENIDLRLSARELLDMLEHDKNLFLEVTTPRLVHWDIWDGNVFVEDGMITGIIDWERCLWGDPLMEVGFRSYAQSPDFLRGYGIGKLTEEESRRILWYDVYLLMIVAQEPVYRKYETAELYDWATTLLGEKMDELKAR